MRTRAPRAFCSRRRLVLGDVDRLHAICREAGIPEAQITRQNGTVRFESIDAMVSTERACAWTLGGVLTNEQFERLLEEAETALRPFVAGDGTMEFDMPSLIIKAQKT